jgi:hypothetical protein
MQQDVSQFRLVSPCFYDSFLQGDNFMSSIRLFRSVKKSTMRRIRNTDQNGNNWSEEIIKAVWNKGNEIPGFDPDKYRKDCCGAWMQFDKFGYISENGVGWEIDHIQPVSKGGTDDLSNLQPLQWQNNRGKSEEFPADDFAVIGSF